MKKILTLFLSSSLFLTSCSPYSFYKSNELTNESYREKEQNKDEDYYVLLYSLTCYYCHESRKAVESYVKSNDINFYTLRLDNLDKSFASELNNEYKNVYLSNVKKYGDNAYIFTDVDNNGTAYNVLDEETYAKSALSNLVTPTLTYFKNGTLNSIRYGFANLNDVSNEFNSIKEK